MRQVHLNMLRKIASIKKRIVVIAFNVLTNSLKILHVTKSELFRLNDFHSDQ